MTTYEQWNSGKISGFGSFHTSLLTSYRLADQQNRELLEFVFPTWFVYDAYFTQADIPEQLKQITVSRAIVALNDVKQPLIMASFGMNIDCFDATLECIDIAIMDLLKHLNAQPHTPNN